MKVSKATAACHRTALLEAAGRLFREGGFDKVSIAEVAAAAGLTHGAFYTYFASKEALAAEVVERAMLQTSEIFDASGDRRRLVETYLSLTHALDRANGCPIAALAGDIARVSPEIRTAFSRGLARLFDNATETLADRQNAVSTVATLVGGLVLARATADEHLRDEILATLRRSLLPSQECAGGPARRGGQPAQRRAGCGPRQHRRDEGIPQS